MFKNINSLTKKINNHLFIRYKNINNSLNCYFILSNKKKYSNYRNTNNKDMIHKKIDFDIHFKKINYNKYITEKDQFLFLENEQHVYDFIIKTRNNLNINYIIDIYLINKDHIKMKLKKRDLYIYNNHIHDNIYSDKRINYIYFIYKKKINVTIENINYNIYCIYYLHDNYSFDDFSQIKYTCIYIYFYVNSKYFLFDNTRCDMILNIENSLPSHQSDIYLYNSLIYSVYNLSNKNNLIEISLEYMNSYRQLFNLLGKKKLVNYPFFWKRK